jgi:hypothetical protein
MRCPSSLELGTVAVVPADESAAAGIAGPSQKRDRRVRRGSGGDAGSRSEK